MLNSWSTRFLLIAALVFSQALSAGHDPLHHNNHSLDCEICLHAATAGSVIASNDITPLFVAGSPLRVFARIRSTRFQLCLDTLRCRAPPLFSL